jgi:hypothetical protein
MDGDTASTIASVARANGVNPAFALAVAERESGGNVNAHASRSISGIFQMTAGLRAQYGAGDSADPAVQTAAWAHFINDTKAQMQQRMGRPVSDPEAYIGHFWGASRAANVLSGQNAGLAPADVFSPNELAQNPELAKGSSAGGLASNIMADINRREAKYGGNPTGNGDSQTDFAQFGQAAGGADEPTDFSQFGQPAVQTAANAPDFAQFGTPAPQPASPSDRPGVDVDFSQFAQAAAAPPATTPVLDQSAPPTAASVT